MSILILNPWDRWIGPNRYLVELMRQAPDLAEDSVIALSNSGSDAAIEYQELGCRIEVWPETALIRTKPTPANLAGTARDHSLGLLQMVRRIRSVGPAVVITNSENVWVGALAARLLRLPHLQVFHALTFEQRFADHRRLLRIYLRWLGSLNRFLIPVSHTLADALRRAGVPADKLRVVVNSVAVNEPNLGRAEERSDGGEVVGDHCPILVCAGRISPMKGQDLLVEALPTVLSAYPGTLCLFVGRTGTRTGLDDIDEFELRLRERISELDLDPNVRFLGEVADLPALLSRANLCVQPSRTESFGRVVAESLLLGTPVVAFAAGGIPEAAGPGALLVPPLDHATLGREIVRALASPEESRLRALAGGEHVRSRFDSSLAAGRFREVVEEVTLGH